MDNRERSEIERDVYVSLRDHFSVLRDEDRRRLAKLEDAQALILGVLVLSTFIAPLISGIIVYLLTKP